MFRFLLTFALTLGRWELFNFVIEKKSMFYILIKYLVCNDKEKMLYCQIFQ